MTVFLVIAAFFAGTVYGYSARANHCVRHHHVHGDDDQGYGYRP